jgi:hypothetical protein
METTNELAIWEVRYTWEVLSSKLLSHPEHTYDKRDSETRAIDCAVAAIDRNDGSAELRLVAAHVRAPGGDWRRVT